LTFEQGIDQTIDWYLAHRDWVEEITSGDYRAYYEKQYGGASSK
jgi:dTDP-glucose 4,6-dehydratase